jgi:hypothetical protein
LLEIGVTAATVLLGCSPVDVARPGAVGGAGGVANAVTTAVTSGGAGRGASGAGGSVTMGMAGASGETGGAGAAGGTAGAAGSSDAGGAAMDAGLPRACLAPVDAGDAVILSNCALRITISKRSGVADYAWNDVARVRGAFAAAKIGTIVQIQDATSHDVVFASPLPFEDKLGAGRKFTVTHQVSHALTLRQNYYLYDDLPYLFVDVEASGPDTVSSNRLSPLVVDATGAIDLGTPADGRILIVPFHNDAFTRYETRAIDGVGESYEATAIYDNATRAGLVIGSVTHDTWKSAVLYGASRGQVQTIEAYGGASSGATQDTAPHGSVSGTTIRSPRMFVGYFADWRSGLEGFSRANAALAPRAHPWTGGVVFGFNTWSAYGCGVTESAYQKASDFVARSLMSKDFRGATSVFLNWDACGAPSTASAGYVKNNGQRAGAYLTPFTSWGTGTDPHILKDDKGVPLPKIDGGYPLDPTHPEVKASVLSSLASYKSMGYEYVKLDFMTHGVREGSHYDKSITTGVQAYNYGLKYIADAVGDSMFIDLSIAPIFPGGQYAHARRVSCDSFGGIANSEYLMNSAGLGWWLNDGVYQYNDPDHIVLGPSAADGS